MLIKLLMLGIWMVLVPLGTGWFIIGVRQHIKLNKDLTTTVSETVSFSFCLGYIAMWALFELITVPFVLAAGKFWHVEFVFEAFCIAFTAAGAYFFWQAHRKAFFSFLRGSVKVNAASALLWLAFLGLLLFQIVQAYRLAYADGDDAYYIPISTAANLGGGMYQIDPYTGKTITLDARHGLAPFPIWVSFIAAKCGVNAAVAAHSLMPLVLIPLTYVIYLEIGRFLCQENKTLLPVFMIFVSLLQIFGNYSIYPASTFLLTRSRQGKAALGNVVFPFLILLFFRIAEEIKERGKAGWQNIVYLALSMTAGCLCSTMSGLLCGLLIMLTAFLLFFVYKKPRILWQGAIGCVPGLFYTSLYFVLNNLRSTLR